MLKGLFKHLWVVFPIIGIVLLLVFMKMRTHETEMAEDKLRFDRNFARDELEMADNPQTKKALQERIKEIDAELKEAKDRKLAARKEEESTMKEFRQSAEEFSKSIDKDIDNKELNNLKKQGIK
jgi:hypothetical protein